MLVDFACLAAASTGPGESNRCTDFAARSGGGMLWMVSRNAGVLVSIGTQGGKRDQHIILVGYLRGTTHRDWVTD